MARSQPSFDAMTGEKMSNDTGLENTSGCVGGVVPAEIARWNWGAFFLNWIWGIGNNTYKALLMFVPIVNLIMPFVLGAKGSSWAWQNRRWESVEAFKTTQRKWAFWGVVVFAVYILLFSGSIASVFIILRYSDAYEIAVKTLNENSSIVQTLGQPIETGWPAGSIQTSTTEIPKANLSFKAKGPKTWGNVYVKASKLPIGQWKIDELVLHEATTGQRIQIGSTYE